MYQTNRRHIRTEKVDSYKMDGPQTRTQNCGSCKRDERHARTAKDGLRGKRKTMMGEKGGKYRKGEKFGIQRVDLFQFIIGRGSLYRDNRIFLYGRQGKREREREHERGNRMVWRHELMSFTASNHANGGPTASLQHLALKEPQQ